MDEQELQVRMLGNFSLRLGEKEIDDGGNRSKKVWLLLAYLIYSRGRIVTQRELMDLMWGDAEGSANPMNALKTMLHRVRGQLDQLGDCVGHQLIIRREGAYAWNMEVPQSLDVEQFDTLCQRGFGAKDEQERLACYLQAAQLYRGDFLSRLSSEPWVMAVAAHYRNLYLQVVQESMTLLVQQDRPEDAARLGRQALAVDPYQEDIYRQLLRILLALGQKREVIALYEDMCKKFLASFDAPPAEDIRDIYRQAVRVSNERAVSMETVQEQLREQDSVPGALVCEYDFFCALYRAMARSIVRTGDPAHICLLSVTGKDGKSLAKRSLERAMQNLEEVLRRNLRRGDVVAKCSVSQFVLLLPRANYENSCGVYNRLVKTFLRQYPHSPAELQGTVRPVEPNP